MDGRLLRAVLENNLKFCVKQELVFNRVAEWFRQDEVERGQHMVELLKLIRVEFIPSEVRLYSFIGVQYPLLFHRRFTVFDGRAAGSYFQAIQSS